MCWIVSYCVVLCGIALGWVVLSLTELCVVSYADLAILGYYIVELSLVGL